MYSCRQRWLGSRVDVASAAEGRAEGGDLGELPSVTLGGFSVSVTLINGPKLSLYQAQWPDSSGAAPPDRPLSLWPQWRFVHLAYSGLDRCFGQAISNSIFVRCLASEGAGIWASGGLLGPILELLAALGAPGPLLGLPWPSPGSLLVLVWRLLGPSWGAPGASWSRLGAS